MGQAEPGGHKCIAVMAPVLRCWLQGRRGAAVRLQSRGASAGSGAEGSCHSFVTLGRVYCLCLIWKFRRRPKNMSSSTFCFPYFFKFPKQRLLLTPDCRFDGRVDGRISDIYLCSGCRLFQHYDDTIKFLINVQSRVPENNQYRFPPSHLRLAT